MKVRFNHPYTTGDEIQNIQKAIESGILSGNGPFTKKCHAWLQQHLNCNKTLLTHSCTAALEMAAILVNISPGDEVIMPSFTFVSTANAVVLRGATPVFIDIRPDTLNIDESKIEEAITEKTRAIFVVHYAGVGCEMDAIMEIAKRHDLPVIEDAAQGINSFYKGKSLGTIGHLGALSFHETKNIISGEGGALLINNKSVEDRAEIIWEKGTNRAQFFRGVVDKYTWVDVGSSFLPSELIAAFLFAQLKFVDEIIEKRKKVWDFYNEGFEQLEKSGDLARPIVPNHTEHNGHIYYIILNDAKTRNRVLKKVRDEGIDAVFHYIPLHTSPAGEKYGITRSQLPVTERVSETLLRLPLWAQMEANIAERVINIVTAAI